VTDWPWSRPRVSLSIYLYLSATEPQGRLRRVGHMSQLPEGHDGTAYHYRRAPFLVGTWYTTSAATPKRSRRSVPTRTQTMPG